MIKMRGVEGSWWLIERDEWTKLASRTSTLSRRPEEEGRYPELEIYYQILFLEVRVQKFRNLQEGNRGCRMQKMQEAKLADARRKQNSHIQLP